MYNQDKIYDVAVIGAGFSGLGATKLALERGLDVCLIADGAGATGYFSGAFDLVDARWCFPAAYLPSDETLIATLEDFMMAHPRHLYSRMAEGKTGFAGNLINEMRAFLDFYRIPYAGDGERAVIVFGSTGMPKPAAFAMATHGLPLEEIRKTDAVTFLDVPGLSDYPRHVIRDNLKKCFSTVDVVELQDWPVNFSSPLASLFMAFDKPDAVPRLAATIKAKIGKAKTVFLPPFLGRERFLENHAELESALGVRVVEFLSAMPATAGLRLQDIIQNVLSDEGATVFQGKAMGPVVQDGEIISVTVTKKNPELDKISLRAKEYILATGKFIGGGISHNGYFTETLFGLPLSAGGECLTAQTHVTQLISPRAVQRQGFLDVGLTTDKEGRPLYQSRIVLQNLRACGHVLSGFDFARDRCGFGVSVASAMQCF